MLKTWAWNLFFCALVLEGSALGGRSGLKLKASCCLASSPLPFTTFDERDGSALLSNTVGGGNDKKQSSISVTLVVKIVISHPTHHDYHRHLCRRECVVTGEDWIRTLQPHYVPPPTQSLLSEIMMIITTEPKLTYSRHGLAGGIVGLGYSSSVYILRS